MQAIEEISRMGSGQAVKMQQQLFHGANDQDFENLLPSMGILTEADEQKHKAFAGMQWGGGRSSASSMADITNQEAIEKSVGTVSQQGFNSKDHVEIQACSHMIVHCFHYPYDILSRYTLDPEELKRWIVSISELYKNNSYHNWLHALDVFQFCFQAITVGKAGEYLNYQDLLAILVAALGHDAAHPGVNNAFLVNTAHDIAITYNDKSPLENMHASLCFKTLRQDGCNFVKEMVRHDLEGFRKKTIDAILATDMAHHFELVDRFSARVAGISDNPFQTGTKDNKDSANASKEDRRMLIQAFVHMGDVGHCCRPWDIHRHMVVGLEKEFFEQGDKERELGMPVMPLMDRTKDSAAASQGFFIGKMVQPLLEATCSVLVDNLASALQVTTSDNGARWKKLIEIHGRLTAAELIEKELAGEKDSQKEEG
jgi:hypothetical protein